MVSSESLASCLTRKLDDVKLDMTPNVADTTALILKHHPELRKTTEENEAKNSEFKPYTVTCPNYGNLNKNFNYYEQNNSLGQYPKNEFNSNVKQEFQQPYSITTPIASKYQTFQAPAQYADVQAMTQSVENQVS